MSLMKGGVERYSCILASLWWYHGSRYGGQAALEKVLKKGT